MRVLFGAVNTDVWGFNGAKLYRFQGTRWNEAGSLTSTANVRAVWGLAVDDLWAVGSGTPLIHHFDGNSWSAVTSVPALPAGAFLNAVWGRSATEIYAVGREGTATTAPGLILRWDGTSWQKETITPVRNVELRGIAGTATQLYAVGDARTALTRVGTVWLQDQAAEMVIATNSTITALVVTPAGELRAGTNGGKIYRFNGTWSFFNEVDGSIQAMQPSSTNGIWVSGFNNNQQEAFLRQPGLFPVPTNETYSDVPPSVFGVPGGDTWSSGYYSLGVTRGIVRRFVSGSGFRDFRDTPFSGDVSSFSGQSGQDIWGAGSSVVHYDGVAWTPYANLGANTVFSCGPNEAWTLSTNGQLTHAVIGSAPATTTLPGATSAWVIRALWGSSCSDLWIGGSTSSVVSTAQTVLFHYVSGAFTRITLFGFPTNTTLQGFFGFAPNDIWATNDSGRLIRYDGTLWAQVPTTAPNGTGVLWGTSANDLWNAACTPGSGCALWHWNGATWSNPGPAPGVTLFTSIHGKSATDAWAFATPQPAFGGPSTMRALHYDGTRWSPMLPIPTIEPMYAVWGSDAGYWGGGGDGLALFHP